MNMRKNFSLLLLLIVCSLISLAQSKPGRLSGQVQDDGQKPIAGATISLLRYSDTTLFKTAVSGKDGRFDFDNLAADKYLMMISAVGYEMMNTALLEVVSGSDTEAGRITLKSAAKNMEGVTITAKKPFIETKIDRTVVNVDASPTNAGATALEVLEKSPGIMVNNDGAISLRGKAGVIVMLDGKPSFLSPGDLANLLKNMPASSIEQIEIMTNPSSRYDASGNAGVINIKTKKGKTAGFNGSVMAGITAGIFGRETIRDPQIAEQHQFQLPEK
jgi:iron complex outermembrane recepter protein